MKTLGILMLDTRFPRVPGDIGNPATFPWPVRYEIVQGASPARVVRERDPRLLAPFISAARHLVDQGADALTTSCGFLVRFQHEMQAAVSVPIWSSSLLLLGELRAPGVITVDASSFGAQELAAAGAPDATPVAGLEPGCAFQRTLLEDRMELDTNDAQSQVVAAARRLIGHHPNLTDIVLECTNMPPYAQTVRQLTGLPVHDVTTLIAQRMAMLPD